MMKSRCFLFFYATVLLAAGSATAPVLAGAVQVLVQDKAGKPIADAVVIALAPAGGAGGAVGNAASNAAATTAATATIIVDQVNKEFVPHVLPIRRGTTVSFPNKDNIRHHVYSFSPAKVFELPLYTGIPASPVLFDKAGAVALGCNIHDWMVAYVYVADSPYFGKTGADGKVVLNDVPAGKYVIHTWHARLIGTEAATEQQIEVARTGSVESISVIGLTPEFRVRRAPLPGKSGY